MVVLWCERRKSGKTPLFSPMFQPICMQIYLLHIIREGQASKHAQSKLLNFHPFYLVFTWFLTEKHFGPLLRSYKRKENEKIYLSISRSVSIHGDGRRGPSAVHPPRQRNHSRLRIQPHASMQNITWVWACLRGNDWQKNHEEIQKLKVLYIAKCATHELMDLAPFDKLVQNNRAKHPNANTPNRRQVDLHDTKKSATRW